MPLSICTIAHGIEVTAAELRIAAADKFLFIRKNFVNWANQRKKAYRFKVGTLSLLYTVFAVLQGCHAVFFFELLHEVVLVFAVKYPVNELVISETVGGKNKPVQTALADERVNILKALGVVVTIFV